MSIPERNFPQNKVPSVNRFWASNPLHIVVTSTSAPDMLWLLGCVDRLIPAYSDVPPPVVHHVFTKPTCCLQQTCDFAPQFGH